MDASTNLELPGDAVTTSAPEERKFRIDIDEIRRSPAFYPGVAVTIGLLALFWGFFKNLPALWFGDDGYYSHGVLVPFITIYVLYRWWPGLKEIKAKPSFWALIGLIPVLWFASRSIAYFVDPMTSIFLVLSILFSVAFVAGWRWMFRTSLPIMYLAFALPIWNMAITYYTNPLQVISTKVAYRMLDFTGFKPVQTENVIYLEGFTLDVGIPCSGLKLVLALYAFTMFFALIARLKWWANIILIAVIPLPLALFINGLRIMLIGVVGVNYGAEAGHKFHDWSGYIALVVCFFVLFRFARWLGWKD